MVEINLEQIYSIIGAIVAGIIATYLKIYNKNDKKNDKVYNEFEYIDEKLKDIHDCIEELEHKIDHQHTEMKQYADDLHDSIANLRNQFINHLERVNHIHED